ncbi:hypothetical protein HSX11_00025 [Oxalobacteraceae bacterium]|nr:hypothetical protein [Oxalobacteraceae bacterium]
MRLPLNISIERLLESVRRLEHTLGAAGLPRWMARLPLGLIAWHYCAMLDEKIARISRIGARMQGWERTLKEFMRSDESKTEFIDVDQRMQRDLEATRLGLWELRTVGLDVARCFEGLDYGAARLRARQTRFVIALEEVCAIAAALQLMVSAHDQSALHLLRQQAASG